MSIFDTTQLALERAIAATTLRNTALADNIANANTPGHQPGDVEFHSALSEAIAGGPATVESLRFSVERSGSAVQRADGSGVDIEAESAKLAENGLELEALVQVAGVRIQIMRTAMGLA